MAQPEETDDRLIRDRYNVAPRQQIPVVERTEDGRRQLRAARWGLLPAWAKTSKDRLQPINARDDKLDGKMWGRLMKPANRVLLPADGYYEWVKAENPKEKPAPFYPVEGKIRPVDMADITGLSRQRVSQILNEKAPATE